MITKQRSVPSLPACSHPAGSEGSLAERAVSREREAGSTAEHLQYAKDDRRADLEALEPMYASLVCVHGLEFEDEAFCGPCLELFVTAMKGVTL